MSHERPAIVQRPYGQRLWVKTSIYLLPLFFSGLCLSATARADWQFQPNLRASETYSNNIRLDRQHPEHDWVSELAAGFSVNRSKERSSAALEYQLQGLHFSRMSAMDEVFQQLHGVTHLQRSETGPYLDGLASLSQQTVDANLPAVSDNIFATGNRADQTDLQLAPGILSKLGSTAMSDLRFSHKQTEYSKGRIDSFTNAINLNLSDAHPKRLDWQWSARKERVRYSNDAATEFRSTLLNIQMSATKRSRILLTGGYDDTRSAVPGQLSRSGSRWSAGIDWAPSHRTHLMLTAGERYFGNTYEMEFTHDYHKDHWGLSYVEDVVTTANDSAILNQVSTGVNGVSTFVTDVYISKLFTASYLHQGHRGDLDVQVYQQRREFGSTLGVEAVRSAVVGGFFQVKPRTGLHWSASLLYRRPALISATDRTRDLSVWLAHDLEKGGSLSLKYRNLHRSGSGFVSGYEASAVSIVYERQFGATSLSGQDSSAVAR